MVARNTLISVAVVLSISIAGINISGFSLLSEVHDVADPSSRPKGVNTQPQHSHHPDVDGDAFTTRLLLPLMKTNSSQPPALSGRHRSGQSGHVIHHMSHNKRRHVEAPPTTSNVNLQPSGTTSTTATTTQQPPQPPTTSPSPPPRPTTAVPPSLIPKIRHMVWKNKTLPTKQATEVYGAWLASEPNFEHIIHDDDECLEMVKTFTEIRAKEDIEGSEIRFLTPALRLLARRAYTYNFTQVYMDYQLNVMRADVCRVMSVYIHGGLYTDLDVHHSRSVASWGVRWDTHDIFIIPENHVHTSNFLFGASPRHPCMRVVLEAMLREGQDPFPFRRSRHAVHHVTGPAVFTRAMASCALDSSYFALPRTLYGRKADPAPSQAQVRVDVELAPYTRVLHLNNTLHFLTGTDTSGNQSNANTTMFAVRVALSKDQMQKGVRHAIASISWKTSRGYSSWTHRRDKTAQQLEAREPVDAIGGRELWPVIRARDDDEQFPTLIPKRRHVVAQTAEALKKLQPTIEAWEAREPHFTTVIHTLESCRHLVRKFEQFKVLSTEQMPDLVCGLLAVHYEGGIFMDSSVCPKTPMANWTHTVPWSTLDLLFTVDGTHQRVGTNIIGAVAENVCVKRILTDMSPLGGYKDVRTGVSQSLLSCSLSNTSHIDPQWTVHYINGFNKYECMRSWVEEEGGRGLAQNYVNTTGTSTFVRPTLTDHQLAAFVDVSSSSCTAHLSTAAPPSPSASKAGSQFWW